VAPRAWTLACRGLQRAARAGGRTARGSRWARLRTDPDRTGVTSASSQL